jgi:hypothetical protein
LKRLSAKGLNLLSDWVSVARPGRQTQGQHIHAGGGQPTSGSSSSSSRCLQPRSSSQAARHALA